MAGYIFAVSQDSWDDFCDNELRNGYFSPLTIYVDEEKKVSEQSIGSYICGPYHYEA